MINFVFDREREKFVSMSAKQSIPLLDNFNRVHDYLRISLTDKCNLRCTYCMPELTNFLPDQHLMQAGEIEKIASLFVNEYGVKKIRITGGEPLIRKNAAEIIRSLGKLDVNLGITTNAVYLDQFLDLFEEIGLQSINISLDTFDSDLFKRITLRDDYERVTGNINLAIARGFRVKINAVIMKGVNEKEIVDFVNRTRDQDLHVRFIEFMPFDGNNWDWERVFPYSEMLKCIRQKFEIEKLNDHPNSTSKGWKVKGHKGTFSVISTITEQFCSGCNRIRLTADGKIRNCLFSTTEYDLLSVLRANEALQPVIEAAIKAKAQKLGGLPEFQDEESLRKSLSERSMVKIGG